MPHQSKESQPSSQTAPSNEYVLNVAFFSFLGFCIFQAIFAVIAHSQAMLADSEAMTVDALTYLFNMCAERIKDRPLSASELDLPQAVREYRREMRRLIMELVPPSISLATLTAVTVFTLQEAFGTLWPSEESDAAEDEDDVSVSLMLIFSGANLLLDIVNVTCFARANSAFGLETVRVENEQIQKGIQLYSTDEQRNCPKGGLPSPLPHEGTALLRPPLAADFSASEGTIVSESDEENDDEFDENNIVELGRVCSSSGPCGKELVNLNMCSAWTHVCADTLRSAAVLIAASIAFLVPSVDGAVADAVAAVAVSIIILVSLLPLLQGLVLTVVELLLLLRNPPSTAAVAPATSIDV